ncbi:MAG TPA: GNAT family N-acetyltransferase [Bacteroidia bacterium]|jgi:GNAT superfamily N-acetyltransferase|nr:GNAT family N-acetyltransferase [Bacteroidia bacterium]
MKIKLASTDSDIEKCFPAFVELRPFLKKEEFLARIRRMMGTGFKIAMLELEDGTVPAVGGFRFEEMLHRGYSVYIDDLSTLPDERSKGYGEKVLDFIIDLARKENCASVHLDSGVQRFAAHRFYLRKRFDITSHHFVLKLAEIN